MYGKKEVKRSLYSLFSRGSCGIFPNLVLFPYIRPKLFRDTGLG